MGDPWDTFYANMIIQSLKKIWNTQTHLKISFEKETNVQVTVQVATPRPKFRSIYYNVAGLDLRVQNWPDQPSFLVLGMQTVHLCWLLVSSTFCILDPARTARWRRSKELPVKTRACHTKGRSRMELMVAGWLALCSQGLTLDLQRQTLGTVFPIWAATGY